MILPPHVYRSDAWPALAEALSAEIERLHVANEAALPERETDRNRGGIALARRILEGAQPAAPLINPIPPDYEG